MPTCVHQWLRTFDVDNEAQDSGAAALSLLERAGIPMETDDRLKSGWFMCAQVLETHFRRWFDPTMETEFPLLPPEYHRESIEEA